MWVKKTKNRIWVTNILVTMRKNISVAKQSPDILLVGIGESDMVEVKKGT